jgi:hypothetical protein
MSSSRHLLDHITLEAEGRYHITHHLHNTSDEIQSDQPYLLPRAQYYLTGQFIRFVKTQRWPIIYSSTKVLLIINLIFISLLSFELAAGGDFSANVGGSPDLTGDEWRKLTINEFHKPSSKIFDVISDRPIFSQSRRKKLHEPPVPEYEYISIELVGTLLTATRRAALVRVGTQQHTEWIREREYISSWKVETILPGSLRLRRIDELRTIDLWPQAEGRPG